MITNRTCVKCDICSNNNHRPIWGDGSHSAQIMFIDSNPSYAERKHNIPQMNKAGMLFQIYLNLFNINRDDVYITYIVKCKTPNGRYPSDCELLNCREHLEEELTTINPKIVVLLGTTAFRSYFNLIGKDIPIDIGKLQGKHLIHNGRIIIFSYSPATIYKYIKYRIDMYKVFIKLIKFIRIYKPWHKTTIGV